MARPKPALWVRLLTKCLGASPGFLQSELIILMHIQQLQCGARLLSEHEASLCQALTSVDNHNTLISSWLLIWVKHLKSLHCSIKEQCLWGNKLRYFHILG